MKVCHFHGAALTWTHKWQKVWRWKTSEKEAQSLLPAWLLQPNFELFMRISGAVKAHWQLKPSLLWPFWWSQCVFVIFSSCLLCVFSLTLLYFDFTSSCGFLYFNFPPLLQLPTWASQMPSRERLYGQTRQRFRYLAKKCVWRSKGQALKP